MCGLELWVWRVRVKWVMGAELGCGVHRGCGWV